MVDGVQVTVYEVLLTLGFETIAQILFERDPRVISYNHSHGFRRLLRTPGVHEHAQAVFQSEYDAGEARRAQITTTYIQESRARGRRALPVEVAIIHRASDNFRILLPLTISPAASTRQRGRSGDLYASLLDYADRFHQELTEVITNDATHRLNFSPIEIVHYLLRNGFIQTAIALIERFQLQEIVTEEEELVESAIRAMRYLIQNQRAQPIRLFFRHLTELFEEGSEVHSQFVDRMVSDVLMQLLSQERENQEEDDERMSANLDEDVSCYSAGEETKSEDEVEKGSGVQETSMAEDEESEEETESIPRLLVDALIMDMNQEQVVEVRRLAEGSGNDDVVTYLEMVSLKDSEPSSPSRKK